MKSIVTTLAIAVMLTLIYAVPSHAQKATYALSKELNSFDEIRVIADTKVEIIKSNRNYLKLIGDSSMVTSLPITQKDSTLFIVHNAIENEVLHKIVIEYKAINRLVTGGKGSVYIAGLDEKELQVFNNSANLTMSGMAENVSIYSQEGENDISGLSAKEIIAYMGEAAKLQKPTLYSNR